MIPPSGVKTRRDECLQLQQALYGLKQAPRAWNKRLSQVMASLRFKQSVTDPCLFFDESQTTFILIYVDDGLILSPS